MSLLKLDIMIIYLSCCVLRFLRLKMASLSDFGALWWLLLHIIRTCSKRVYYSLAVWRFRPILSAGLRFHSHLSGGLRLRNYRAVAGNHKFSSRFSVFACFCGGYSNKVKRLRRLSGNIILLKTSLCNKGLPFRARPSQSGLPSVPPAMWGGVER